MSGGKEVESLEVEPRDRNEDKELGEQQRQAGRERAARAREYFEMMRQRQIQDQRKAAGVCIQCGGALSRIDRLLHLIQHRSCQVFTE